MKPLLALAFLLLAPPALADTLRVATWDIGFTRDGAGVLLADLADPDDGVRAAAAVLRSVRPDVLLLTGFDHDLRGRALETFAALLATGPDRLDYPARFHAPVNAGEPSGRDLDGDGRTVQPPDAFGWGRFPGHGGMAILSRLPIDADAARSFRLLPWSALPGADLPRRPDGTPFPDADSQALLRLSSRAHWDVPAVLPDGTRLHLLAANPTPPLFDGPEGFNRRRNADEIRFWSLYLDGTAFPDDQGRTAGPPAGPHVLLGNLNLDPADGAGDHAAIAALLAHPRLHDVRPGSPGAAAAATPGHAGDPSLDTADWRDDDPGNLRVDYVLPSAGLVVAARGVHWPAPGERLAAETAAASAHRLVWLDLTLP
jgi:hypothetical protein